MRKSMKTQKYAKDALKDCGLASGKEISIVWKNDTEGNRQVNLNGISAFRQGKNDSESIFLPPFDNLTLP